MMKKTLMNALLMLLFTSTTTTACPLDCQHGTCRYRFGLHSCHCEEGYEGSLCETKKSASLRLNSASSEQNAVPVESTVGGTAATSPADLANIMGTMNADINQELDKLRPAATPEKEEDSSEEEETSSEEESSEQETSSEQESSSSSSSQTSPKDIGLNAVMTDINTTVQKDTPSASTTSNNNNCGREDFWRRFATSTITFFAGIILGFLIDWMFHTCNQSNRSSNNNNNNNKTASGGEGEAKINPKPPAPVV